MLETGAKYREMRNADETTDSEKELVHGVRQWAGEPDPAPAEAE